MDRSGGDSKISYISNGEKLPDSSRNINHFPAETSDGFLYARDPMFRQTYIDLE
jgi:hypothetical protein